MQPGNETRRLTDYNIFFEKYMRNIVENLVADSFIRNQN